MINVLFVEFKKVFGGGQVSLLSLLENLDKAAVNPIVLCQPNSEIIKRLGQIGIQHQTIPLGRIQKSRNILVLLRNLVSLIEPTLKLACLIKESHIQIIYANGIFSFIASCLAAKITGIPIILVMRNISISLRSPITTSFLLTLASSIIVVTNEIKREFERLKGRPIEKLRVIHNGVNLNRHTLTTRAQGVPELRSEKGDVLVGTACRLSKEKGLEYLIEAASEVMLAFPLAKFAIIGDGPLGADLRQRVIEAGVQDRFLFTGFAENCLPWVSAMDIFVLPSLEEALPVSVIEAMALKKPIVATSVGGVPELVQDGLNGFVVPPGDSVQLASAILRLCQDREMRIAMGNIGRKVVEKSFRIEFTVGKTLQVFREHIHNSRVYTCDSLKETVCG